MHELGGAFLRGRFGRVAAAARGDHRGGDGATTACGVLLRWQMGGGDGVMDTDTSRHAVLLVRSWCVDEPGPDRRSPGLNATARPYGRADALLCIHSSDCRQGLRHSGGAAADSAGWLHGRGSQQAGSAAAVCRGRVGAPSTVLQEVFMSRSTAMALADLARRVSGKAGRFPAPAVRPWG